MTVQELIDELSKLDPVATIYLHDGDGDMREPSIADEGSFVRIDDGSVYVLNRERDGWIAY